MKKVNKFKMAGLTAVVMGGMAFAGAGYAQTPKSGYQELKKEVSTMSVDEVKKLIKECDTALKTLRKTIDSPETNPEERFHAENAYENITARRAIYQARLGELKKQQAKTIDIRDAARTR